MKITEVRRVSIYRYNRTDHVRDVMNNSEVIKWVEYQILKWGNIRDQDGCVYGVDCDDQETKIKAQYVFDKYAQKQLVGWYEAEADEKTYISINRIKIFCKELNDFCNSRK